MNNLHIRYFNMTIENPPDKNNLFFSITDTYGYLTLSLPIMYTYIVFYVPLQPKNVNKPRIFKRQRVNKLTSQFRQSDDVCHRDVMCEWQ